MRVARAPHIQYWHDLSWLFGGFVAVAAWDVVGLDAAVSRNFGNGGGFAWREHWLTSLVLHEGARDLAWLVFVGLVASLWRPFPYARGLARSERLAWIATTIACVAVVTLLKRVSLTSCPWSLAEFGGIAWQVSHWAFGTADGGPGHCFPAGHANAAFCFLPGYFFLRASAPVAARRWLLVTLVAGVILGGTQVVRGAHFVSHVLWTGWWCWAVSLIAVGVERAWARRSFAALAATSQVAANSTRTT